MIVYVVSIPWDSSRVRDSFVFECKKYAEEFCTIKNKDGYNGFINGLVVECVEVIRTRERDEE